MRTAIGRRLDRILGRTDENETVQEVLRPTVHPPPAPRQVLFLGTSEGGKTTLIGRLESMKRASEVRKEIVELVLRVTCDAVSEIVKSDLAPVEDAEFEDAYELITRMTKNQSSVKNLAVQPDNEGIEYTYFDDDCYDALTYLWALPVFQAHEITTYDGGEARYTMYMSKLLQQYPSWGAAGWSLDPEDSCGPPRRTRGFRSVDMEHKRRYKDGKHGNVEKLTILDVGGERCERSKWRYLMENLKTIVFCVAASEYDQMLYENPEVNRLAESLNLFKTLVNNEYVPDITYTKLVIVFTHIDLFREKFVTKKIPLNVSGLFPDAPTNNEDVKSGLTYLTDLFVSKMPKSKTISIYHLDSISSPDEELEMLMDEFLFDPYQELILLGTDT